MAGDAMTGHANLSHAANAWQRAEVRAWRRGCRPTSLIGLEPDQFEEDFDFDPNEISDDNAVEFHAMIPTAADLATVDRFAFHGADGAVHWIVCDLFLTALRVQPTRHSEMRNKDHTFGTDGNETGVFFPEFGAPQGFGRHGQPSLSDILSGGFVPVGACQALSPNGSFQVDGDDPDLEIRNPRHDRSMPGLPADRSGIAACLPPDALVVTSDGMTPLTDIAEGKVVQTSDHGWQPVSWICGVTSPTQEPAYLATQQGIPVSPSHSVGRVLLMTGRFSSCAARRASKIQPVLS